METKNIRLTASSTTISEKIQLTGRKWEQKTYYRHTGHPGGLKATTAQQMIADKPTKMVELAIHGMLPKTRQGNAMKTRLKVYAGSEHPHAAQQPEVYELQS